MQPAPRFQHLADPSGRFQTLISTPVAFAIGAIGATVTVALATAPNVTTLVGAIGIGVLYSQYVVVSLLWGTRSDRLIEGGFGMLGGAAIIALALQHDPRWLAAGWALHGIWDVLHHHDHHVVGMRTIPRWWIQTCLVWDVPAAIGLFFVLTP